MKVWPEKKTKRRKLMKDEKVKGEMTSSGTHEFFVLNLTDRSLTGQVMWENNKENPGKDEKVSIAVNELQPANISEKKQFFPVEGKNDYWRYSEKGRTYQLNCYDKDRYAVVTISDYGIGVLVTATSPDTWEW
jgi:hypothetical protein